MNEPVCDVIVVGAGHAGLAISYFLKRYGLNHIVLERSQIGNSWRTQRWDSFKMNTPNKTNRLPSIEAYFSNPDEFISAEEFLCLLREYAKQYKLPIKEHSEVIAIEKNEADLFLISISENGIDKQYLSRQVVVASGTRNTKYVPDFANKIAGRIMQLHSSEYRNAACFPPGAILIVGSGQSGAQIAEDLLESGKNVFISSSRVGRVPRRYRGKDIEEWLIITGIYDVKTEDADIQVKNARQPLISGIGPQGKTISLQSLSERGAVILGKTENTDGTNFFLKDNAFENIRFGDDSSQKIKNIIDEYIDKNEIEASSPEIDYADIPDTNGNSASAITTLDLEKENISVIIWATGFKERFDYIKLPIHNDFGEINHKNGVSKIEGLYFIGIPWLCTAKSGIIWGIQEDAEMLSKCILAYNQDLTVT